MAIQTELLLLVLLIAVTVVAQLIISMMGSRTYKKH
jgi:hypothetical protein